MDYQQWLYIPGDVGDMQKRELRGNKQVCLDYVSVATEDFCK